MLLACLLNYLVSVLFTLEMSDEFLRHMLGKHHRICCKCREVSHGNDQSIKFPRQTLWQTLCQSLGQTLVAGEEGQLGEHVLDMQQK